LELTGRARLDLMQRAAASRLQDSKISMYQAPSGKQREQRPFPLA